MAEAFKACRAASQSISVASNGGRGSQEVADACSPRRRAIRRRHSVVDEGRGGHVVARHILHYVLEQVKDGIRSNAWLMLSEDPTQNIWTYYNIIKVTPIVMDDYLMVILTIPLIDSSLDVNLYKVYNLPTS